MKLSKTFSAACFAFGAACLSAHAQVTFNGSVSTDYGTAGNWSSNSVPNLTTGITAQIANGSAVNYAAGTDVGDLLISNGGELELTNGSWTQTGNNNWIQLQGNGTILVNGGTLNQGTSGNSPFNVSGTGNAFTITSGAANFNSLNEGNSVTFNINGGTVTDANGTVVIQGTTVYDQTAGSFSDSGSININNTGTFLLAGGTFTSSGEFDFNGANSTISGGILNVPLLTGVNSANLGVFTVSGGLINVSGGTGIYAPSSTTPINFTLNSTGEINFEGVSASTVQGFLSSGGIEDAGTINPSAFVVTSTGANSATVALVAAAPEPSTYVMFGLGFAALLFGMRRRSASVRL